MTLRGRASGPYLCGEFAESRQELLEDERPVRLVESEHQINRRLVAGKGPAHDGLTGDKLPMEAGSSARPLRRPDQRRRHSKVIDFEMRPDGDALIAFEISVDDAAQYMRGTAEIPMKVSPIILRGSIELSAANSWSRRRIATSGSRQDELEVEFGTRLAADEMRHRACPAGGRRRDRRKSRYNILMSRSGRSSCKTLIVAGMQSSSCPVTKPMANTGFAGCAIRRADSIAAAA